MGEFHQNGYVTTFHNQSIFCLSNITTRTRSVRLTDLNLIDTETWTDLITDQHYDDRHGIIRLAPYQTVWITNRLVKPVDTVIPSATR